MKKLTLEEILGPKAAAEMRARKYAEAVEETALVEKVLASTDPVVVAVRELHKPQTELSWVDCEGCREECLYCEGDHGWPCETILAVGRALP